VFDALDWETVTEMELLYRDGLIGGRGPLMFATHTMSLLHSLAGMFSKQHKTLRPAEWFPFIEAYFKPAEPTRAERDYLLLTTLPGYKPEYLKHLQARHG